MNQGDKNESKLLTEENINLTYLSFSKALSFKSNSISHKLEKN